ncbi:type II toxin-antitoxin system HicA family toxin [Thiolapillus sp.]|nr:type II toxin-antitoxin system HicA family toxin [Thiolapillus sp.]
MSKLSKAKERLRQQPKGYTWDEACSLVRTLGFKKVEGSGSRVKFFNPESGDLISLHKPHPRNVMKPYAIKDLYRFLNERGLLK